jgi:hypothetical protein
VQTRRDHVQIEFQQFSTPPALAFLADTAAGVCTGMTVLEPSAGTGNMAVFARRAGAHVDTNEIDPRRRDLLRLQGFEPTAIDAERLDGHSTAFGARHVEQALLRLKAGGRLVAIVGRGMALDRPTFRDWWAAIAGVTRYAPTSASTDTSIQSLARRSTTSWS